MNYLVENWEVIASICVGIGAVIVGIVKLTPTKKDDEFVDKHKGTAITIFEKLSKLIGKK